VTTGIVSARGRDIHSGQFDDFLQIDAPINRGNSAARRLNLNGEVIGIKHCDLFARTRQRRHRLRGSVEPRQIGGGADRAARQVSQRLAWRVADPGGDAGDRTSPWAENAACALVAGVNANSRVPKPA